jgi:hypothetical protein
VQPHWESFAPAKVTDKTSALTAQVSSEYFTFLMENVGFFIRELSPSVETTFVLVKIISNIILPKKVILSSSLIFFSQIFFSTLFEIVSSTSTFPST